MNTPYWLNLTPAALVILAAAPAFAQVDETAKRTLTESADAIKNMGSATFTVKMTTEGLGNFVFSSDMKVKLIRDPKATAASAAHSYQLVGTFKAPGGKPGDEVVHAALIEGKMGEWIDEKAKTLFIRPMRGGPKSDVLSKVQTPSKAFESVFLDPAPFKGELEAPVLALDRSVNVGGEECRVVKATLAGGKAFRYVYISALDKLPRKYEQRMGEEGSAQQVRSFEIIGLNSDTKLTLADIHLKQPEGGKTDKVDLPPPPPPAPKPSPSDAAKDAAKKEEAIKKEQELEEKKEKEKDAQKGKVPESYEVDAPTNRPGKKN